MRDRDNCIGDKALTGLRVVAGLDQTMCEVRSTRPPTIGEDKPRSKWDNGNYFRKICRFSISQVYPLWRGLRAGHYGKATRPLSS